VKNTLAFGKLERSKAGTDCLFLKCRAEKSVEVITTL